MARPVTLFTGQWADLSLETICQAVQPMGYNGLELACWGDHFDVTRALKDRGYCKKRWEMLADHRLDVFAISNHLVGQAVCDPIDERHKAILPPEVWGNGDPERVRRRAAKRMIDTAKACRRFMDAAPPAPGSRPSSKSVPSRRGRKLNQRPGVVNGFTGSSIWHAVYAFPPTSQAYLDRGYKDFAKRWKSILDAFDRVNVNFALEAHPTEIAFDTATAWRAIKSLDGHRRFGFNYDPSHLAYQGVDYVQFLRSLANRIFHTHIKDVWWDRGDGTVGVFGGHTDFADPRRYWDFRSPGRGHIDFERIIVALNDIGYVGPLSVEWEDTRMDREHGAAEACRFVRSLDFKPSGTAFDTAFDR